MYRNIFDTHSHYTDSAFDEDRNELIKNIHENCGVRNIMLAVSEYDDAVKSLALSRSFDFVYCAAGIHPECVDTAEPDYIEKLEKLITENRDKIKAVGEIGLDYHYENYDREKQIEIFTNQLKLAEKLQLPVIIHSRDATQDTMDILRKHTPKKAVVHCYSGSAETAKELISLGLHISFTGVLTFKNAKKAIEALKVIPVERFMLETDCPYMAPVPYRGTRCDSSMIEKIAEKAAEIKEMDVQELIDITYSNAVKFFEIEENAE